jgi:hypothetical protein
MDFIIIGLMILLLNEKYKHNKVIINILLCVLITCVLLIFGELYYGSTFYYGEIRDKQGLPFLINNFGLFGSVIFLSFVTNFFIGKSAIRKKNKIVLNMILFVLISFFHFLLYKLLAVSWRMLSS